MSLSEIAIVQSYNGSLGYDRAEEILRVHLQLTCEFLKSATIKETVKESNLWPKFEYIATVMTIYESEYTFDSFKIKVNNIFMMRSAKGFLKFRTIPEWVGTPIMFIKSGVEEFGEDDIRRYHILGRDHFTLTLISDIEKIIRFTDTHLMYRLLPQHEWLKTVVKNLSRKELRYSMLGWRRAYVVSEPD